ncbi:heavy-metal-associated domain-containing protein [Eremococcus coleocola]|uniref:Heavy metal-associated domain protein n=1 Tax=Eremococcus coleocola ACS-139-V-Col8 TaxID=908337 RepID=E4KRC3_9LACT|nr:heavy metal-associated domain-containing protein [Eremococcus coleocola]EFR30500.1 heavy metal-associated domain protein [Eremococcus coleocola ACS-139-V-Col8]
MEKTYEVTGMKCQGCANTVESKLNQVAGVTAAKVDLAKHQAQLEGDFQDADLQAALADTNYALNL